MSPNCRDAAPGRWVWTTIVALGCWLPLPVAGAEAETLHHTLLPESSLLDDCPPCGRPSIAEPLRGGFDLRLRDANPLFAHYAIENVSFTAGSAGGRSYRVTGHGTYTVGGEVALLQDLSLELFIDDGFTNRPCSFTNASPQVGRLWPMLLAAAVQTNGTFTQVYHLQIASAPFREIWFSTANGMTPGTPQPPAKHLSGGDLLSSAGRVVKRNRELTAVLGFMPSPEPPDLGLDAADVLPGGEVVFSVEQEAFSESLGPLHAGDLLSSHGTVVKSNGELVARFQPADPKLDYGLDAFFVWPSGEVWFSVETGFQGQHLELYHRGDLLSDQGYVVFRNLELVAPFQPLEDLADFGLDALFIVTDAAANTSAPSFTRIQTLANGAIGLEWKGNGRAWELWHSAEVLGPWLPVSPVIPDPHFETPPAVSSPRFYRLIQW